MDDGSQVITFSNGQVETLTDTCHLIEYPDGTRRSITDSGEQCYFVNGTSWHIDYSEGTKCIDYPDGVRECHYDNGPIQKQRWDADGKTLRIKYRDGTRQIKSLQ